jgi:hypothetical protein
MSWLAPTKFVTKMVGAAESRTFMETKDSLVRA